MTRGDHRARTRKRRRDRRRLRQQLVAHEVLRRLQRLAKGWSGPHEIRIPASRKVELREWQTSDPVVSPMEIDAALWTAYGTPTPTR